MPKSPPKGFQRGSEAPKTPPRCDQEATRCRQEAKEPPKSFPRGTTRPPRGRQVKPRGSQAAAMRPQEAPRDPRGARSHPTPETAGTTDQRAPRLARISATGVSGLETRNRGNQHAARGRCSQPSMPPARPFGHPLCCPSPAVPKIYRTHAQALSRFAHSTAVARTVRLTNATSGPSSSAMTSSCTSAARRCRHSSSREL